MAFTMDYDPLTGVPFVQGALPPVEPARSPAPVVTPTTQVAPRQEPPPAAARPAEPRPSAPAQPGGQETIEALRQLLAQFQARAATPRAESQSGGLLDSLRQRIQTQMGEEDDRRIRDIGIGMLTSRSPNFFTMLGEGLKAGEEGSRARMDRLRQAVETERQERALDVEEARRQEELRIREAAQAADAPLRAAQTRQALAYADYLSRDRGQGQITVSQRLQAERDAAARARIAHPDLPTIPPPTVAQQAELQRLREAYIARELPRLLAAAANPGQVPTAPAAAATAPAAPAAVIDLRTNPGGNPPR